MNLPPCRQVDPPEYDETGLSRTRKSTGATRHKSRTSVNFVNFDAYPSIEPPIDAFTNPPSTVSVSPTT
jgi:hypothetical protein